MTTPRDRSLTIRQGGPEDRAAVIDLLSASLGWAADAHMADFFAWKHDQNHFGPSPSWVAVDHGEIVGFRTFLRWEFEDRDGAVHRAVRAVDTATHPHHQGRGIFRRLTLAALDDLAAEGVAFVFNTPNSQSRPGYLKMGWKEVGRLPATARLTSLRSPWRMARSRVAAERWSTPCTVGRAPEEVFDDPSIDELLAPTEPEGALRTHRSRGYMRWRYGFRPLAYRVVTLSDRAGDGLAVFRLRARGAALECALVEVLLRRGDRSGHRALLRSVARASGADYVIRMGGPPVDRSGFVRLPRQGPILTWRPLTGGSTPGGALDDWRLSLGDVELF